MIFNTRLKINDLSELAEATGEMPLKHTALCSVMRRHGGQLMEVNGYAKELNSLTGIFFTAQVGGQVTS